MKKVDISILDRTPVGEDKNRLARIFSEYAQQFQYEAQRIEFGKQDSRGAPSISLVTVYGTIGQQKHFQNYRQLIAYVEGYLSAQEVGRL